MITRDAEQSTITLPRFRKIIWLLPAAYFLHIIEEYLGGFPAWVTHDVHRRFDDTAFAVNNVAFMVTLLTLVYLNYRKSTPLRGVLLVVFASGNLFWDALFHLFMTPILDRYSPGLVTSMLLYYPICILVGAVITKEKILAPRLLLSASMGGLALFGFVVWYGGSTSPHLSSIVWIGERQSTPGPSRTGGASRLVTSERDRDGGRARGLPRQQACRRSRSRWSAPCAPPMPH